jgi:RND family efflux transporter MFP subunit
MKTWIGLAGGVVAGGAVVLGLVGCGKHGSGEGIEGGPARPVVVAEAETGSRPIFEEVVGTVRTRMRAVVEAKVSGRVKALDVILGQRVKEGDVVAEIDAQEIRARYEQAVAQRDQARKDLERATALVKKQVSSRQEFDAVEARFRVADAQVREAETMLGYAQVTAPFDGVVSRRLAEVGDLAVPGKALLEIEDRGALRFEADVPEALIDRVASGQKIAVAIPAVEKVFEGDVVEVSPTADAASRTFLVKLDLPEESVLRTGQFGRAAIPVGEAVSVVVPEGAVVVRGQMEMVFVVDGGVARLRLVKTGKRRDGGVEILSGLRGGETVVAVDAPLLVDGMRVEVAQ